ncbi:hypothetical protein [Microbulbifer sp. TRSA007]|uniref:hypothetical protein n=1 Tax=Microbulbifer sp. TRSA007 TaxID=3243384 RepID=UPI004039537E
MARIKSESEKAAGKLISAIQKEWGVEIGEPCSGASEDVMDLAHNLLQARTSKGMEKILNRLSLQEYLGFEWVEKHPGVVPAIEKLRQAMAQENA